MRNTAVILLIVAFLQATVPAYTARLRRAGYLSDLSLKIYSIGIGEVMATFRFNVLSKGELVIFVENPLNLSSVKGFAFGMEFAVHQILACKPTEPPEDYKKPLFWSERDRMHDNRDFVRRVHYDSPSRSSYDILNNKHIIFFSTKRSEYNVGAFNFEGISPYIPLGCGIITDDPGIAEAFRKSMFEPPPRPGEKTMNFEQKIKVIMWCLFLIGLILQIKG